MKIDILQNGAHNIETLQKYENWMDGMNLNIAIREATLEDVPAMLDIYNHAVKTLTATADLEPRTLEDRLEWFRKRQAANMPILVAEDEQSTVVGWASLGYFRDRAGYNHTLEDSIYIAEGSRRCGLGRLMLDRLLESAKAMPIKVHAIVAGIDGENVGSVQLHRSFGFVEAGRLPQVMTKFGRWLDLIYMVKLLD